MIRICKIANTTKFISAIAEASFPAMLAIAFSVMNLKQSFWDRITK
jgi:hypothetical protein